MRTNRGPRARVSPDDAVAWSPADLSPEGWWRADLGVTEVSLEVTDWANQGTAAVPIPDTSQSTGTLRPDLIASDAAFNNQAVVHGDGGDALPTAATPAWELGADGDDYTILAVASQDVAGIGTCACSTDGGVSGFVRLAARSGGNARFQTEDVVPVAVTANGINMTATQVYALAGVYTGAVSPALDSATFWTDGVAGTAATVDQGQIKGSVLAAFVLLAQRVSGTAPLNGKLAEVIYLRRLLTAGEDALLTAYLNTRYAMSLPGVTQ